MSRLHTPIRTHPTWHTRSPWCYKETQSWAGRDRQEPLESHCGGRAIFSSVPCPHCMAQFQSITQAFIRAFEESGRSARLLHVGKYTCTPPQAMESSSVQEECRWSERGPAAATLTTALTPFLISCWLGGWLILSRCWNTWLPHARWLIISVHRNDYPWEGHNTTKRTV